MYTPFRSHSVKAGLSRPQTSTRERLPLQIGCAIWWPLLGSSLRAPGHAGQIILGLIAPSSGIHAQLQSVSTAESPEFLPFLGSTSEPLSQFGEGGALRSEP